MKTDEQHNGGISAYRKVKGHFVIQGTTITQWARDNGTQIQNLRSAFYGSWDGPKATALVAKAIKDSGVELEKAA